jgi:hypothetical protein
MPAAADPALNLVECIAGCGDVARKVVYYTPRQSTITGLPIRHGGVTTIASAAPAPSGSNAAVIPCVAGCYDGPKTYAARPAPAAMQRAALDAKPMTAPQVQGQMTPTSAAMSAAMDAPKPQEVLARPCKPRQRRVTQKRVKPMQWRTVVRQASVPRPIQPRGWTTVVRY